MNNTPDNNSRNDIRGLYDFVTEVGRQTKNPYPLSFQDFSRVMQKEANRRGLYDKLSKRAGIGGTYEDFERAFFNPYASETNQVEALRSKTFTRDPKKEMARRRALMDASRGEYNPYGTSEVSYNPDRRMRGTEIAPIDLVESEDTPPEIATSTGPKTTRTFGGGVVSGLRGIRGGAEIAVAELLKMFGGGDSDDEREAIHLINQMEKDGTLSLDTVREMRKKLGTRIATYTPAGFIYTPPSGKISRQLDALNLIEERMQKLGQDLTPEKREAALDAMRSDLSEKGAGEDKANPFVRWKEGAKDYMRKSEVPEGTWAELGSATASVGGAIAGQAISMIPGAAPVGQAISWASIGAQTISSGGQAIMDMEDYAAEKGVYISPEDKATISLGYMAAEFGGDALGGAVASKSISAIGKLAGGRLGKKLAVRSLAKGIAGNEGVRQSLSSLSEYAQKPLAIPLAKSAGRQIVRGAVTEGPGESLTTLAQSGALDRVWKSKEDQEAWANVARQAVKDGIYGAWAGALMGGFGAGIQGGQVARMHRKEGLTLVQDEKNKLYEVIGSDQSSYLVLDRAGRQKMLPADQVVDAIHYTPQERQKSQKAYDEATEGLHPKEEVLTENQKQAGAILSATEQQQSPIYRATHPDVAEEDLNSPVALAGAKEALADVLEGQSEEVKTRVDQMALVLRDGEADPTEELTKLFSDESLSDNDRQSILDVVTAQSRLATIERSHQEAMAQMQRELTKEWSAKSVVGDETARGAVISATITDVDGKPKQVYVTGGVRVVTNENGTVELLPTEDDVPIYVYDESVDGEEKGHIVQMDDLSSPQLVAEDYLDMVQASLDEAETAFRSEVQAAEEQTAKSHQATEEIEFPNGTRGTALKGEPALTEFDRILEERASSATALPTPIESAEAFEREFADPVQTPISSVRVTQGAFEKIVGKGRLRVSGAIRPTLENPDLIIKDGDAYLYVKVYRSADGTVSHNIVSVEKSIDGENILVSIHPKTDSNLRNKIKSGGLLTLQTSANAEQGEQPQGLQSELPTDLYGKGTEKSEGEQFLSSLPRTREGEVDGLKLMSERPDDFIRYLGQLYGDDFVASLPLSKNGALDLKALTPEQTLKVNEAALGKSGAVEAARQRRSKVGAERSKLEAEVKSDLGNLEKRMALRKASEEYRLYDDYVRTAEEQARQELEAQKRSEEEALTPEERQRREEEKRQLAQEKKEREERIRLENERRRREREELERNAEGSTVREYTEDPPRQARTRGARLVNGTVVYRQEPMTVEHYADAERAFSQRPGETRVPVKRTIVEAESLQASHKEGRMNPRHFIPEAQPKDRADNGLSSTAADRIASDIRPDEITGGITAYTGAPVVNGRGEVIQGNNRTDALQTMYDGEERHAKSAELYKEYLKAHASEYGMTAEQVDAMAHPVAVDVAEVSDSEAIRLGHRGQTDLESAGADTMNAQTVGEELNSDTDPQSGQSMLVSFFNRIFNRTGVNGTELSAKMDNMLNRNAEEGLQFLHENGYITDTQYKNAFETNSEGKRVVTAEAKTALKDVALYQLADVIGPRAMDIFYRLPASARNGLATFLYRDSQASFETSLAPDLGDALLVWDSLRQDPDFAGQTNFESAKIFILGKVSLFGRSELETNLGEASSLAKLLAASMQTQTEEQIASALNNYYDLVGANATGAKTQSLMPTSQPTDTKAGAAEAVYGRVYEVPSGREKHYRFRRDVAEEFRARRDALADRITEERRKRAAAMDMARTLGVPMKLHEDMSTLPDEVRAGFDETHFVKGWFYKGDNAIHIYLPANVDADDVRATFLHEAVGHYGCRELLGEVGYNQVLDGIANKLGEEEVLRAMSEYGNGSQDLTNLGQVRIAMDEWIAHRAESGITKKTVWESIKDFFRNVFGLSGKQIDQSAEMMADDLLRRSAENLQKRAERQQGVSLDEAPEEAEVRMRAERYVPEISYSDERDSNGHRFIHASNGSVEFGEIKAETGLPAGGIRLSEGFQNKETRTGYGMLHMEANHGEEIRKAGFSSVRDFVEYVGKGYQEIRKGTTRDGGGQTYLIELPGDHNNTLFIECVEGTEGDKTYWNVNSGGVFRKGYSDKKAVVWSVPALGDNVSTDTAKFGTSSEERTKSENAMSGNSSQTTALRKDTESTDGEQPKGSEQRFRQAERDGDISAAAEAASDFFHNATPKNITIDNVLRFKRVYHNSPHLLKKADGAFVDPETGERLGFDHRFMGSGEGAQSHGWGSYFGVKDLDWYAPRQDLLAPDGFKFIRNSHYVTSHKGTSYTSRILFNLVRRAYNDGLRTEKEVRESVTDRIKQLRQESEKRVKMSRRLLEAIKKKEAWALSLSKLDKGEPIVDNKTGYTYVATFFPEEEAKTHYDSSRKAIKQYDDALTFISDNPDFIPYFVTESNESGRHKYIVEIPDPSAFEYIQERKHLSDKTKELVLQAMKEDPLPTGDISEHTLSRVNGRAFYDLLRKAFETEGRSTPDNYNKAKQAASEWLSRAGIVGIHYYGRIDGECYVIFNDKDAKITDHIRFRREEREKIRKDAIADGTWMKAPNGENSNLSERDWVTVRTTAFKDWFGDWEDKNSSHSLIVDSNGEPLPVYHYTSEDFTVFDRSKARKATDVDGFFFAPSHEDWSAMGDKLITAFLNIRRPAINPVLALGQTYDAGVKERLRLEREGYDGIINGDSEEGIEYVAFYPNQIKRTDGEAFSPNSDDIRFRRKVEQNKEEVNRTFNEELEKFAVGELPPKHVFNLGYPSPILISAGILDAPIEITSRIIKRKSSSAKHVFDPLLLRDLPKALQHPIAITEYKKEDNHVNIIVELTNNGENLLVGVKASIRNRSQVNDVKGLFHKSTSGWLRWLEGEKVRYVNNEKVQEIKETRRTNPARQSQLFLNSGTNVINKSEDTKTESQNSTDPTLRFRMAERAGDVSGAAEAAIDFMRNATPKNTTVDDVLRFCRVYHNSPHLLKKADGAFVDPETGEHLGFDHRFMGSGEGFQAHGWGSYFSVKDLEGYASPNDVEVYDGIRLTQNDAYVTSRGGSTNIASILFQTIRTCWTRNGSIASEKAVKKSVGETLRRIYQKYEQNAREEERLIEALKDNEPWAVTLISSVRGSSAIDPKTGYEYATRTFSVEEEKRTYEYAKRQADRYKAALLFTKSNPDYVRHFETKVTRHKYTVEIPDPDTNHYIKEDRRVTKREAEMIRDAINNNPETKGSPLADESWRGRKWVEAYELLSRRLGGEDRASSLLNKAGFVGIHYNGRIDGECYVIFNENDAKITDHIRFRRTSEAERLEIERKAKADGSWLLAPDGTPTTLSEDGWIASRTSDFRAEYGDWEKASNGRWLLGNHYVKELSGNEFEKSETSLIDMVANYYEREHHGCAFRNGIGYVSLSKRTVKDSMAHFSLYRDRVAAFKAVPEVIKRGVQIDGETEWKGRSYDSLTISAPISIGGEGYICTVIVKLVGDDSHGKFYLHKIDLQKNLREELSENNTSENTLGEIEAVVKPHISTGSTPLTIANVLKEYVSHKDDLPESFYQANGEPKREIVEEYLRAEEEKEVRYRRVKADPMNAISPINPQWDGEWYGSEDLTGKSTADLLELPAAPAVPEKRPTQSVAEYAETMSRHYADPRVRFRTGAHTESLRTPQPPRITDGMSLYEVAQLQHEYNRNYRDFSEESMRRMGALDKRPEKFIRHQIDVARPVELFVEEMKRLGLEVSPEDNMYWSLMLQSSKELNMKKREVEPMFERYAGTIREMNLDGSLEKVPSVSYVYMKDPNVKKSKSVVKDANGYEKASLYLQAKDIDECKKLGLPYRGEKGFEDLVTNKETGKKISPEEYISLFENAVGKARAEGLCDQIRAISNWSTQKLYEAGLLTEDRYHELTRGSRRYYVPQRGFKITEDTDRRAYELAELKAEGRQSLSADPVANLQAICNTTVIRAIRNRDLLDFYRWCKKNEQELYHRGVLEMGESYYRRTDEVDDKGRRVYLQSKKAPTLEEMRADNQTRREMAKIRMEKAALREKADRGLISSYTFEAKTKELDDRLKAKEDELIVKYRDPNLSLDDTDKTAKKDERVVRVYENGEERIIALSEDYSGKAVANALNNRSIGRYIDSDNLIAKIFRGLGTITRTLSSLRTQYSPAFAVKNAVRDMNAAVAANIGDFGWAYTQQFLRNVPKVQRAVWEYVWKENFGDVGDLNSGYGQYMKEFFEDGAATGYSFLEPFNILHKNLKGIAEPTTWNNIVHGRKGAKNLYATMRLCAVLSEGSELSTRFAEYVTSRERGFSRKEAAIHAKEVTVNFNRHGAISPYLNTLFGFWNASVQGAYRWYRIPLRFMAKVSAQLFVTGMLQAYLYLRDDDDNDFTEWDLMTNLCIGDFRYPLPQNLRAFNGAGLQFMLACMGKKDWQAAVIDAAQFMAGEYLPSEAASLLNVVQWDETRGTLKDGWHQVWRDAAPTGISPIVDVIENRNFMGQPVYKMPYVRSQDDNVAHWSLGKKRTKQVYKDFAEWQWKMRGGSTERNDLMSRNGTSQLSNSKLNNPSVIEHLVEGYGGGPISGLADIGTWVEFASTGDVKGLKKLQMIAPFFRQERDYTATDVKYWELTDLYRSRQQTMSNLRKAKEGEDLERYREMTRRVSELAPRMTREQLTEKIWEDGTKDEKLYVTWLETKALLKQIDKGTVTKEEVAPTIDRLTEQFRELR